MKPEFLSQAALQVAPQLLGCLLVRHTKAGDIKIRIVETEAYHQTDPASHSFRGLTKRTAPMFEGGGHIYIYFTYGMHYCLNIVAGEQGVGEGVLIRAGEPIEGLELMQANRDVDELKNLTNGPGKLAQALGIKDTKMSGRKLGPQTIELLTPGKDAKVEVVSGPRIGIRQAMDQPWRFYVKDNPFVSKL